MERAELDEIFCLRRQLERNPVTIGDAFEFMREAGKRIERFWVYRFVERNKDKPVVHEAVLMEKGRHDVSAHDTERYFEIVGMHLKRRFITLRVERRRDKNWISEDAVSTINDYYKRCPTGNEYFGCCAR
jgi:hypothetical protein